MPRASSVKRLPPEIKERIHLLFEEGRTLDEIMQALASLGAEVSRSALGRYSQSLDKVAEKVRRSREVADALVRRLGDAPESRTLRLNVELMHSAILDLFLANEERDSEGTFYLARSLEALAKASKLDTDMTVKVRQEAEAKAKREADARIAKAVDAAGNEAARSNLSSQEVLERVKAIYRGEA